MRAILETQYFLQRSTISDEKTRVKYRRAVMWLGEMLGREPIISDLTDDNLAGLMKWLEIHRQQGATTINISRKAIVAFWRWLHSRGLVPTGPTVAPLKTPRRTPRARTHDELRRLVQAALERPGSIGGMPAGQWWITLLATELATGVRASELLSLRWEWLDLDSGTLRVPAECRKGRSSDATYRLPADLMDWLRPIAKPSGLLLGFDRTPSRYYQLWHDLLDAAGLPRDRRGMTQALRRTFATLVHAAGGDASAALGHSNPAVARESYIDPTTTQTRHGDAIPADWRPLGMIPGGNCSKISNSSNEKPRRSEGATGPG